MKPNSLPTFSDDLPGLELTEHYTKFTVTSKQYVSNFVEPIETGYEFENWKIEPFIGFKITMDDGSYLILTKPEEFEQFGIFDFEHDTIDCSPENDCNV